MPANLSVFHKGNIVDTCAVWNILSSLRLYRAALDAGVVFACTGVVEYECLLKPRKSPLTVEESTLRTRLNAAKQQRGILVFSLDVEDLQTVELLEKRKRLGKGELSSIAFAQKTRQAMLTDDQKAHRLANEVLQSPGAQTTPHLFGWLLFNNRLSDGDKAFVIDEHKHLNRPLAPHFETNYIEACRCRWMAGQ